MSNTILLLLNVHVSCIGIIMKLMTGLYYLKNKKYEREALVFCERQQSVGARVHTFGFIMFVYIISAVFAADVLIAAQAIFQSHAVSTNEHVEFL